MAAAMKSEKNKTPEFVENQTNSKLEREVSDKLLELIGTPPNFVSVKSHQINRSWFRVNIRTLKEGHSGLIRLTKIAHSYFVQYKEGSFIDGDKVENLYKPANNNNDDKLQ